MAYFVNEAFQSFIVVLQEQWLNLCVISLPDFILFFLSLSSLPKQSLPALGNIPIKHSYKFINLSHSFKLLSDTSIISQTSGY